MKIVSSWLGLSTPDHEVTPKNRAGTLLVLGFHNTIDFIQRKSSHPLEMDRSFASNPSFLKMKVDVYEFNSGHSGKLKGVKIQF